MGATGGSGETASSDDSGKNPNNVIGGHKATLNNPSQYLCFHPVLTAFTERNTDTSEEAKQHSKEVLQQEGHDVGGTGGSGETGGSDDSGKNPNNVIGGLKAYVDDHP